MTDVMKGKLYHLFFDEVQHKQCSWRDDKVVCGLQQKVYWSYESWKTFPPHNTNMAFFGGLLTTVLLSLTKALLIINPAFVQFLVDCDFAGCRHRFR